MSVVSWKVFTEWESVVSFWSPLLERSSTHTFFQELSIQQAWWKSANEPSLQLVTVFVDEQPVALFPFCAKEQTLQFLGDQDVSDYLDVMIMPEFQHAAFTALSEYLQQADWQTLSLLSIPEHSLSLQGVQQLATQHQWSFQQTQQDVCPIIELPATWEEYLAHVGKKQRHEIKRKWLRLEEQGKVTFRTVTDTNADSTALDTFFTLHRQSSVDKEKFWTAEHRRYFEELSNAASTGGWLRLYFLDFNGVPSATMYCFEYGEDLLIYNSGFNAGAFIDRSIGHVITAYTIQDAIARKKKKYDFLRGGEEYKMRYRPIAHPVFNLLVEKASGS